MPLVNQNSSEINEVHTETSHFPGGEWGGREEEVVNAAGSIGGNLQMASIGCMRETCGSVGPGLSEVCHSALLLPSPPSCRTVVRCMCVMLDLSGIATCSKWFSWESSVSPVSRKCLRNPVHWGYVSIVSFQALWEGSLEVYLSVHNNVNRCQALTSSTQKRKTSCLATLNVLGEKKIKNLKRGRQGEGQKAALSKCLPSRTGKSSEVMQIFARMYTT